MGEFKKNKPGCISTSNTRASESFLYKNKFALLLGGMTLFETLINSSWVYVGSHSRMFKFKNAVVKPLLITSMAVLAGHAADKIDDFYERKNASKKQSSLDAAQRSPGSIAYRYMNKNNGSHCDPWLVRVLHCPL